VSAEAPRVMVIVAALAEFNDKSNERSARHKIIGMVSHDRTREESLFIENPRVSDRLQKTLLPGPLKVKSV
jgi:hypothetical protein